MMTKFHDLSKYSKETIQYIRDCKDEIENMIVVEFTSDGFEEVSAEDLKRRTKIACTLAGVGEGLVDSSEEFDDLYAAIEL